MVEALAQDARYTLRLMRKTPGFTAIAVLTLALGIGANTAIFSILDPLLLRKLPVSHPDELVLLDAAGTIGKAGMWPVLALDRFRSQSQAISGALAFAPVHFLRESTDGLSAGVRAQLVSGDYFSLLGVRPYAGRLLEPDDDRGAFGNQVAVLSYDYWRREFRSDPAIVGKMVPLHNMTYTVVGIAPPEFQGMVLGEPPDFYLPLKAGRPIESSDPYSPGEWVTMVARLRPGVSSQQAQAALQPLLPKIADDAGLPEVERKQVMARLVLNGVARGVSSLRERYSLPARILMAVVMLVLLIACSNVANLLLAQGEARRPEIAVRLALGAGRRQLVRQLLMQAFMLAAAGAVAGLVLAQWTSRLLASSVSTDSSGARLDYGLDGRVLLFTLAATAATVLLCGLVPAISATRLEARPNLSVRGAGEGRRYLPLRLGKNLVLGQVALSVALLLTSGLLLHSLINLETFDAGFNRDRALSAVMNGSATARSPQQVGHFYDRLLARVQALPGVQSASLSLFTPVSGRELGINLRVEGHDTQAGEETHAFFNSVGPNYFASLGIPLLAGRDFSAQDTPDAPPVAIINQTMARHYFGDQSPLGKTFMTVEGHRGPFEIIGLVSDSKYNDLREQTPDFFYMDRLQSPPPTVVRSTLVVRAAGASAAMLASPVRNLIRRLDDTVTISSVKTLREQVDESLGQDRLIASLCGAFSLLALVLTCIGLYGLLSFNVARRSGEIGIRMALGAGKRGIFRLVIGDGIRLVLPGLLLGMAGALFADKLVRSLLFGVRRADPATFITIAALLALAALLACYVPARRATAVDPLAALRNE
jgi:putative ABC transport system permease protein